MAKWVLSVVLILVVCVPTAFAQPIYQWKDEKGQWHFSNFPQPGVESKKVTEGLGTPEPLPNNSPVDSKENSVSKLPNANLPDEGHISLDRRWFLIIAPSNQNSADDAKPFSGWTFWQFFDSGQACNHAKAVLIGNSTSTSDGITTVNFQLLNSTCIAAAKFVTGKAADVVVASTEFELVAGGFSGVILTGKVINRGQATARSVVAKYQVRTATDGFVVLQGEVPISPEEIPELTLAEFRTPSILGRSAQDIVVQVEIDWAKK
jgi:hypothetical protein